MKYLCETCKLIWYSSSEPITRCGDPFCRGDCQPVPPEPEETIIAETDSNTSYTGVEDATQPSDT